MDLILTDITDIIRINDTKIKVFIVTILSLEHVWIKFKPTSHLLINEVYWKVFIGLDNYVNRVKLPLLSVLNLFIIHFCV